MANRKNSDEFYVIDLCDKILGSKALRQHTFDFLRGDGNPGRKLPVDAYYPTQKLVIEYRERQHSESVAFFNKKETVSGVSRDEQRRIYDQRRRDVLPKYGIRLIEVSYSDLNHDSRKRLIRNDERNIYTLKRILGIDVGNSSIESKQKTTPRHIRPQRDSKEEHKLEHRDTWFYRAYKKFGCLFIAAVITGVMFLSVWLSVNFFHFNEDITYFFTFVVLCIVGGIGHYLTTEKELQEQDEQEKHLQETNTDVDTKDIFCWKCGSPLIEIDEEGICTCWNCGFIFKPDY